MFYKLLFVIFSIVFVNRTYGCRGNKQIIKSGGLTVYDKQMIVNEHNYYRQLVALGQISRQPPAANMMEMRWDDELAARAQQWTDQCVVDHDSTQNRDIGRFAVGQNLAANWTTKTPNSPDDYEPKFSNAIKSWFNEHTRFWFTVINGPDPVTGHYTQMVWGESYLVGCGYTMFYDRYERRNYRLLVCNYGPAGNIRGSMPYERGNPACGSYGLTDSSKYSGLCSYSYKTSYETVYNNNRGYETNVIPESGSNSYNYYENDRYNYENNWQHQSSWSTYNQNSPAKPFYNLFNQASNFITSAKQRTANTILGTSTYLTKPTGFKFGTYYL